AWHADDLPAPSPEKRKPEEKKEMTITGRVLDSNGKPAPGATVAVMGWARSPLRSRQQGPSWPKALAQGKTDRQGHFHFLIPQTSKELFWEVFVMARASGHVLGLQDIDPDARQSDAEIRLSPEAVLAGRLVDLQ